MNLFSITAEGNKYMLFFKFDPFTATLDKDLEICAPITAHWDL